MEPEAPLEYQLLPLTEKETETQESKTRPRGLLMAELGPESTGLLLIRGISTAFGCEIANLFAFSRPS